MSGSGFSLLWSRILESSLWVTESKETRLLWIAMLAMKDSSGRVFGSVVGLADRAKLTADECRSALNVLLSPDQNDTSGVEEGRRLRVIEGGWEIVNHEKYRFSTEARREMWRLRKQAQREEAERKQAAAQAGRKRPKNGKPLPGEVPYCAAVAERGPEPMVAGEQWADESKETEV